MGFLGGTSGEEPTSQSKRHMQVVTLDWEHSPEEGMATHSSIIAWRIP